MYPSFHSDEFGSLQLIFGPMFSGKTTELMRRIKRYEIAKKRCLVIKYGADSRYTDEDKAVTHDRHLGELSQLVENYDVLGIDEGQFVRYWHIFFLDRRFLLSTLSLCESFSDIVQFPDVATFCEKWSNLGKVIIVAALDGTFQRKPFGQVLELVPMAEKVSKLSAVCMGCGKDAAFSRRITCETAVEVIGGADKYVAMCRNCYNKEDAAAMRTAMTPVKIKDDAPEFAQEAARQLSACSSSP